MSPDWKEIQRRLIESIEYAQTLEADLAAAQAIITEMKKNPLRNIKNPSVRETIFALVYEELANNYKESFHEGQKCGIAAAIASAFEKAFKELRE